MEWALSVKVLIGLSYYLFGFVSPTLFSDVDCYHLLCLVVVWCTGGGGGGGQLLPHQESAGQQGMRVGESCSHGAGQFCHHSHIPHPPKGLYLNS